MVDSFISADAKLQLENSTRWFSSYLMLFSFKRAYDCQNGVGAFPVQFPCPISKLVIEKYLQILAISYQFNLIMEKDSSNISEVVPSLMIMMSKWMRMEVSGQYKTFCEKLVSSFKKKFEFELNSPVYLVSSLLNTSKLGSWYNRSDCEDIRQKAFDNVCEVYKVLSCLKLIIYDFFI